jgi:hypothetical protein
MEEVKLTCFEVETTYVSGFTKVEHIVTLNEDTLWEYYDMHHNKAKIDSVVIVDAYCY